MKHIKLILLLLWQ